MNVGHAAVFNFNPLLIKFESFGVEGLVGNNFIYIMFNGRLLFKWWLKPSLIHFDVKILAMALFAGIWLKLGFQLPKNQFLELSGRPYSWEASGIWHSNLCSGQRFGKKKPPFATHFISIMYFIVSNFDSRMPLHNFLPQVVWVRDNLMVWEKDIFLMFNRKCVMSKDWDKIIIQICLP